MLAAISDTLESIEEEFLSADARVKEVFNHWKEASPSVGVLQNAMRQYQRLHIAMLQALSNASALVGRVNQLSSHLKHIHGQQELILAVESGRIEDTTEVLDKFREDRRVAVEEAENSKDQANSVSLQVHALKQHRESLYARLEELEDERRLELASHIKSARDEVDILRDHVAVEQLKAQTARGEMLEIVDRLDMLHGEIGRLANLTAIEQQSLKTADGLPEHSRKEADAIGILLKDLVLEEEHLNSKLNELNNQLEACDDQAGEILSQQGTSATAGEKLRSRLADKKRANDELTRDIEMAKLATEQHLAERVTLSMELDKLEKEEKLQIENVKNGQRTRGFFLQRVKKEEHQVKQAQDEMLPLDTSIKNMTIQIVAQKKEFETLRSSRTKLQAEVQDLLGRVAEEKSMTEVQKSLVKARLRHVHELDKECSDIQVTVYKREKLAQRAVSGRDRAGRQASSLIGKLHDALELAEAKDGQVDELRQRRRTVRAQEKGLRSLCGMLREQMGHCISVHKSAERCVQGLEEKVKQAEDVLKQMSSTADCRTADLKKAESVSRAAGYTRAQLTNCLAARKQKHNAVYAEIDQAMLNVACLKRAVEDGKAAHDRMAQIVTAAADAKCAAEQALVGRGSELCKLYEQSNACQILNDEGKQALSRCSDDIRLLQLEVAELERKLLATHKTAPDVVSYDRSVAQLKAEVFKARREAEQLSVTLEDPSLAPDRWRLLPGSIPSRQELTDRMGKIESKLSSRLNQIAQKELTLEELQGLIDSLVQQAAATHDGAFQLSVQMNDCQRGLQGMTRRMMATVSELALYQALSIKYAAGREALQAQLAAARSNMDQGVAPTGSADQEYARLERTAARQAEVRQQAAEVRQLKEAGLLGQVQSRASPRWHAYLPDTEEGLPRPFLAPFAPFKPTGHLFAAPCPAAPTIAQGSPAVKQLVVGTAT